jgi:hypothetical protein
MKVSGIVVSVNLVLAGMLAGLGFLVAGAPAEDER